MSANISRDDNSISGLSIINFENKNLTYSKDLRQFLLDLFIKYKFRKVNFVVVIGNLIEKMYDKYIEKYGGRIVGIYKDHIKLQDGNLYDQKLYEIFPNEKIK